jgi:hypothetical protein
MTQIFKNHKSSGRNVEKWMTCNLNLKDIKNGSGFKKGGITIRNKSFLRKDTDTFNNSIKLRPNIF